MTNETGPPAMLGPIVGAVGEGCVRIVLALPGRQVPLLTCRLCSEGAEDRLVEARPDHGDFQVFLFPFDGLPTDRACHYGFEAEDGPLDLEGLTGEDCRFRAPGPFEPGDSLLLTSCHRPGARLPDGNGESRSWAPWRHLRELVDSEPGVRLLVLGGDQVYNDAVEAEHLDDLDDEEGMAELQGALILSYAAHWGHLDHRRALARIPSLAMWDDHDITDGWGSRPEQFGGETVEPRWLRYFDGCRQAFAALQASRNPEGLLGHDGAPFSTVLDLGQDRLLLLDLRSERNARTSTLWESAHEAAVLAVLEPGRGPRRTLVLSPVVAFRSNPDKDRRLGRWTRRLFAVTRWWELRRWVRRTWMLGLPLFFAAGLVSPLLLPLLAAWALVGGVPELLIRVPVLPHLTDDLEDGLTADPNRKALARLLEALLRRHREHGPVALLAGDVHLQGLAELVDARREPAVALLQIVSSPITNAPMPKVAAGFTTTSSPILPDPNEPRLFARNIAWFSRRGFAQVVPDGLDGRAGRPAVLFHLEGHEEPLAFPGSFLAPRTRQGVEGPSTPSQSASTRR